MAAQQGGHLSFRGHRGKREQALNRVPEPEEANDAATIRELARTEFRTFAPPSFAGDIECHIDAAVEGAGVLERLTDRRRYIQDIRWNARKQAVLVWREFYRDPLRRKLILEDLQREHGRKAGPVTHAALLRLDPDEQFVYLLRTRSHRFNVRDTAKVLGRRQWRKVDSMFVRVERKMISSVPGREKRC